MNGIKMSDCDFYVDEEKRTVACIYPKEDARSFYGAKELVLDFIDDNLDFPDIDLSRGIAYKLLKKLEMPYRFVGKAVCSPDDEWDEEIGRMIAFSRLKDKIYTSFFKRASLFISTLSWRLDEAAEAFDTFGAKISANRDALDEKIEKALASKEE